MALRIDNAKLLRTVWRNTQTELCVETLGDIGIHGGMREIVREGEPWRKKQFEEFISTVWSEVSEKESSAIVTKMRESEYASNKKYGDVIPADWRPRSHLEYMRVVTDPKEYCYDPEQFPLYTALRVD